MRHDKFQGRVADSGRGCAAPDCVEAGEFRAPGERGSSFDGPGDYRWFCLDHVREFNAGYDWFHGMSADEIVAAQHPAAGWASEARAFSATAGIDAAPRWADFADPLEAIAARARARRPVERTDGRVLTAEQRRAFDVMRPGYDADRSALRRRYSKLVRKYHPDRNGGDRSHEKALQAVIDAYTQLRARPAFAGPGA